MSDDKEIRDMLDKDFEAAEKRLQNGGKSDPAAHGEILLLMAKHLRILARRNTVTEDDCLARVAKGECGIGKIQSPFFAHLFKDAPPWVIIGYFIAKSNGWVQ